MAWTASPHISSGIPITATSGDRRDGTRRVLDLDRVHVLAAGHDHVLHPVDQVEVALARRGSPRRRCGTSRRGTPPRSPPGRFQYSRMKLPPRAHTSPIVARRPRASRSGSWIDRRTPEHRAARRAQQLAPATVVLVGEQRQHRRALGHAVALAQLESGSSVEQPVEQRRRAWATRRRSSTCERGQPLGPEVGVVEQHGDHRRHHHRLVDRAWSR